MMTPDTRESLENLRNHVAEGVGDIAFECTSSGGHGWDDIGAILASCPIGVTDRSGWLADELYNNTSLVSDLVGDRMWDILHQGGLDPHDPDTWAEAVKIVQGVLTHLPGLTAKLTR